jgi:N-acyl-D-aspartate/D-glutamate deacylase
MHDLLIHGGPVIDGSGAPGVRADVAIRDGRIVALGDLSGETAAKRLDAEGRVVAPGFIDMRESDRENAETRHRRQADQPDHLRMPAGGSTITPCTELETSVNARMKASETP